MAGINFDRAADYYDSTRGLPDQVLAAIADLLIAELPGGRECLEIGVGTGRIALPLHQRGVRLVGADISSAMLARLVANAGGQLPFPLLLADATYLPLVDGCFGAVIASHVFHLIPDWKLSADEALRVLAPAGVLLVDFGGDQPAPWGAKIAEIERRHGVVRARGGVSSPEQVAEYLGDRVHSHKLAPIEFTVGQRLEDDLFQLENQMHSWTWQASTAQVQAAADEIRSWAAETGWPPDKEVGIQRTIQWWAFRSAT